MKVSVIVPTYKRSQDLERCLKALKCQSRPADEVLVVVRDSDDETHQFLECLALSELSLQVVDVSVPGQVAALNAGLAAAQGDVIAITDDDAAPHPDWLERIEAHFLQDEKVGGVGGRDWVYEKGNSKPLRGPSDPSILVGKLQWFGRTIGNHHLGVGPTREVDILKGANMSYRKTAILDLKFSGDLKGVGAQVSNDMAFSLLVKSKGWRLLYDPAVAVNHFPAQRFDEDQRSQFNPIAQRNMAHNETLVVLENLPSFGKVVYLVWALIIGTRAVPGLVQIVRFFPVQKQISIHRGLASFQGRCAGVNTWLSRSE
jgi:cellulose synthase/poly-beta-1,6-N-acetylglucosamine synthase-like glycosyltransferase